MKTISLHYVLLLLTLLSPMALSAQELTVKSLEQVKKKDYAVVFASDPRPVYAVAMNVDADKRTIEQPEVERVK